MSYSTVQAEIRKIDRHIDGVRAELRAQIKYDQLDPADCQRAWDAFPMLRACETALFRRRGELQEERGKFLRLAAAKAARRARSPKRCQTCGGSGYAKSSSRLEGVS